MNLLTKTIGTFLLTLALSAFAFGGSNFNGESFFETNRTDIPAFVTDTNFRWWQPSQPVPTYASYARADIAWTDGYVIFYNPHFTSQIPQKVAAFVLAHEYGHIYGRTTNENASDTFAAQVYSQTDKSVCAAAVWWMINFPNPGDATHPPSRVRAQNIAQVCGV